MTSNDERKPWSVVYDRDLDTRGFLTWLQIQHAAWEGVNFPSSEKDVFHSLAGMIEELGELSHALLKDSQKIRGSHEEHMAAAKDAVGDIFIYCAGLCNKLGINMEDAIRVAWIEVGNRDWIKNRQDGSVLVDNEHDANRDTW